MDVECLADTGESIFILLLAAILLIASGVAIVFLSRRRDGKKLIGITTSVIVGGIILFSPAHTAFAAEGCEGSSSTDSRQSDDSASQGSSISPTDPTSPDPTPSIPDSVDQPAATIISDRNYFANPRVIDNDTSEWRTQSGSNATYETGQAQWSNGTTTDVTNMTATSNGNTLVYYRSGYASVPAGPLNVSFDYSVDSTEAGRVVISVRWYDAGGARVSDVEDTINISNSDIHRINMSTDKPAGATDLRISVKPQGYLIDSSFRVTNFYLGTNSGTYFSGASSDTATDDFSWDGTKDQSSSTHVSSPMPRPVITSSDMTNSVNPVVSGTAEAGSRVIVTIDNYGYETTAGDDGVWSLKIAKPLTNYASYNLVVSATDPSTGQTSLLATQQLLVKADAAQAQFYTHNGLIYAPDDSVFTPIGANVGVLDIYNSNGYAAGDHQGVAQGHSDDVLDWNWNAIRVNLRVTDGKPAWYRSTNGYEALKSMVDDIVSEYTAKKIVVVLDAHDLWQLGEGELGLNAPHLGQVDEFWRDMGNDYKNNPYVWFNLHNEIGLGDDDWVEFNLHGIEVVRSTGARNMIVVDSPGYAGDQGTVETRIAMNNFSYNSTMGPKLFTAADGNLVISSHVYNGLYATEKGLSTYIGQLHEVGLPLMIGEYGYTTDGSTTAGSYAGNVAGANAVWSLGQANHVGFFWWNATHGVDHYSLKNNDLSFFAGGAGSNLSPAGQQLWDLTH